MRPRAIALEHDADSDYPISLHQLKRDLSIDHDELDDLIMLEHLPAAVSFAENFMLRSIMAKTHRWILADFPRGGDQAIYLPRGNVTAVASVAYSSGGAVTTLTGPSSGSPAGTDYQEDLRGRPRLMPLRGRCWPAVDVDVPAPIVITFTAGWTTHDAVPREIARGVTAKICEYLEAPGAPLANRNTVDVDFAEKLLSAWRVLA